MNKQMPKLPVKPAANKGAANALPIAQGGIPSQQPLPPELLAEMGAAQPMPAAGEQLYPITVEGKTHELTLDELMAYAADGLAKQNGYIRRNRMANTMPQGQVYAAFVEEYPEVKPEQIPPQVWEWAAQEGSLVSAYRKWEVLCLRDELETLQLNRKNRKQAVGTAKGDGEPVGVDPVTMALLGK